MGNFAPDVRGVNRNPLQPQSFMSDCRHGLTRCRCGRVFPATLIYVIRTHGEVPVPIYYFNVRGDGFDVPDIAGRLCADPTAARREAELMAADLIGTALAAGELPLDAVIEVDDEEQRPVLALPLREVRR